MNADLKDARILIVDDQPANVEVLKQFLEIKGYVNIRATEDSRQVLPLIQEQAPDLLLLDLMMPHLSGFEVMELLKKEGKLLSRMPVLVLTADATQESKRRALSGGARDFLTKPFDLVEVDLRIRNLLTMVYLYDELLEQNQMLDVKVRQRTQELLKSLEVLKTQNALLKDIAWSQSHLVRAPLARIMGVIPFLKEGETPEFTLAMMVDIVAESCKELDTVIRHVTEKTYQNELLDETSENASLSKD